MDIEPLLIQSLQLLGLGMGAVFIILILLIAIISVVSRLVPQEPSPATALSSRTPVDNEHIAAISAALHQYRNRK